MTVPRDHDLGQKANQDSKVGLLTSQADKEVKAETEVEKEDEAEITTMETTNSDKEATAEIGITVEEEKEEIIVETDTTEKEVIKLVMKMSILFSRNLKKKVTLKKKILTE